MENNLPTSEHLHTREAAVIVPIQQAGAVGVAALLVFVVVPVSAGVPIYNVIGPASASAVVCGVGFLAFRFWHWAQLTERIERATGIDLPGGLSAVEIAQPDTSEPRILRVNVYEYDKNGNMTGGKRGAEIPEDFLLRIARGWKDGRQFSIPQLVTRKPSVCGRKEYEKYAPVMLETGMIQYKNATYPDLGFDYTEAGKTALNSLLHSPEE